MITAKQLESKSLDELAILAERSDPGSAQDFLVKAEIERRARLGGSQSKVWHETAIGKLLIGVIVLIVSIYLIPLAKLK
jgi:hypothetical protein